ncbi:MAG: hypothetical protein HY720_03515 [Planctomycetes bacterium]|nr:hypothetical protein [Planctomycetota bacterium]
MSGVHRSAVVLTFRARPGKREELLAFLARAFPFYEKHGDTRMRLWVDKGDPERFAEIALCSDEASFAAMQERVERDPETKAVLAEWRSLIEDLEVKAYEEVLPGGKGR